MADSTDRRSLRMMLRQRRLAIPARRRRHDALRLAWRLYRWPPFRKARHIAFYMASQGELATDLARMLARRGPRRTYLPLMRRFPGGRLGFTPALPRHRLHRHRWGILQARGGRPRSACQLDLILLPLTGFDRQGNRLGMGGGFYDRSLARCPDWRPLRVGVAHACQEVARVPVAGWDMPVHAVATPAAIIDCRPARRRGYQARR